MIIRGGENIQPTEIENYICSMDQVQDCYVIGVPSKRLGKLKCSVRGDIDVGDEIVGDRFDRHQNFNLILNYNEIKCYKIPFD